ncbi:hypothetical protein QUB63_30445 [Microcoleus sp. ARI1-B5]|uniref:hypothetical protein n=1 Tax=unclassified Microcoleus TaxID=2642155 RepID=UPI002FD73FA1
MKLKSISWHCLFLSAIALSLELTVCSRLSVSAQELPTLAKNMSYVAARARLQDAGWQAAYNYYSPGRIAALNAIEKYIITKFWFAELVACPETARGLCYFKFVTAEGKTLTITTTNNSAGKQPSIVRWEVEPAKFKLSQPLPMLRQDSPYAEVRQALINAGWQPVSDSYLSPSDRDRADRSGYPELQACSGTGLGFCSFIFSAANGQKLRVITAGQNSTLYGWSIETGR